MTNDAKPVPQAAKAAAAQAASATLSASGAKSAGKDTTPPVHVSYSADFASHAQYADGVHGISLRGGVAHIDLYQTVVPGNEKQGQPEQRVVTHRVVLPLLAFAEISRIMTSMRDAVQTAVKQQEAEKVKQ